MRHPARREGGSGLVRSLLRRRTGDPPPIVVGGTGGSGTRVVQMVLAQAGVFMGSRLNEAGDAMDFEPFLDACINPVLAVTRSLDYSPEMLPADLRRLVRAMLDAAAARYRAGRPRGSVWGWKNPRSMYVLPLIHARYPEMTFVHVVRDGRDMALSPNRNQLGKHYEALFGEPGSPADNQAALRLWAASNRQVAAWCERRLGSRYLRLRFEDFCADPSASCTALVRRLGLPSGSGEQLAVLVVPPPTLGRWRDAGAAALSPDPAAEAALAAFGYR